MIKAERAKLVSKILNEYYPETPVPLEHSSVYTLLIAVLLSAQCTDERVNKVTPYLFKLASSPEAMSKISQQKMETYLTSAQGEGGARGGGRELETVLVFTIMRQRRRGLLSAC